MRTCGVRCRRQRQGRKPNRKQEALRRGEKLFQEHGADLGGEARALFPKGDAASLLGHVDGAGARGAADHLHELQGQEGQGDDAARRGNLRPSRRIPQGAV